MTDSQKKISTTDREATILVVNGSPEQLALMTGLLGNAGYDVITATAGREGFELARRLRPDLVISGVETVDGDGIELCRKIRAHTLLRTIPLLLSSSLPVDDASVVKGLEAGADDYLEVPYDIIQLIGKVVRLIERSRSEKAVRDSEKLFRLLVEGVKDYAIFMLDAEGKIISWNEGVKRVLGYDEPQIVGRHFSCIFTSEDVRSGAPEQELEKAEREGVAEDERWHVRYDGERFWASGAVTPLRDDGGVLRGFAKVMRDTTERQRSDRHERFLSEASATLAASLDYETTLKSLTRLAVPALADWCVVDMLDEKGSLERLAVAHTDPGREDLAREMSRRYPYDSQGGHPVIKVLRTGEAAMAACVSDEMLAAVYSEAEQLEFVRNLGFKSFMIVPLVARGRVLGAISLVSAESGRRYDAWDLAFAKELARRAALAVDNARLYRESQDAVRRHEESLALLETVLATAPVGLAFLDRELRYVRVNETLAAINGAPPDEHIGRAASEMIPDLAGVLEPILRRVIETGEPVTGLELSREATASSKGEKCYYLSSYYPVRALDGQPVWVGSVVVDITDRRRAEEERLELLGREYEARRKAEEANRLKDEFLATLSHELRTPLTSILGWSRLLRSNGLDKASTARALESIERNAHAQKQLIDDILDVSRIITGKVHLDIQPISLISVIEAAVDGVRPAAGAKGIELCVSLPSQIGLISGDPNRLQQVVWNLLTNAIKFTPEGGRVELRLERTQSSVRIKISDNGRGIKPEFLSYVFDRFRQADATTTRQQGGLGLGLAIVRHLVELHGGEVSVESAGEGQGATFTVALPLAGVVNWSAKEPQRREPAPTKAVEPESPPSLDDLRVLIVDDEEDTLDFLKALLENCGAEVITATSTAEAVRIFVKVLPDVLIADIGMPGQDGYALIRKVRSFGEKQGGRVPAIALTAYAQEQDRMKSYRAGYQMHLAKPFEPSELMAVVASFAGRTH